MASRVFRGMVRSAALAAAVAMAAPAVVRADEQLSPAASQPDQQQVMQELDALRERIRQLESQQVERTERASAAEVDATVDRVIRDADERSQLMQMQGFTAGWNKGKFALQSENGDFVLMPSFWMQLRYVANYREEDAADSVSGDATAESGFELRRMKFIFDGNAFGPKLKYRFQFNTNRNNGNTFLEDAFVSYKLNDWLAVKAGQFKEPTFHEELLSDVRQIAAERSLVNFTLGGGNTDRVQGAALILDDGPQGSPFRGEVGYTDGPNSDNTNFVDGGGAPFFDVGSPDFGVYGRAEYLVFGDWKNYEDFTSMGTDKPLLVAGAGASYAQAGDNNVLFHTADVQYEQGSIGAYAAYYGAYSDSEDDGSLYDAGLLAQVSYLINPKWEAFGRYEFIHLDGARDLNEDDYHVLGAGVNYYIVKSHAAKVTVDVMYLPDGTPVNADGLGILDPDADGDQFVLRAQFQLLL